jgi:hypothetical protein
VYIGVVAWMVGRPVGLRLKVQQVWVETWACMTRGEIKVRIQDKKESRMPIVRAL